MTDGYGLLKPALFSVPPEAAHETTLRLLRGVQHTPVRSLLERRYVVDDPALSVEAFETSFPNPVGVAAGFDKNAHVPVGLAALGFGHVEIGGVTAEAQPGNPRPRLFRLPEDRALINRLGFNNEGADVVGERLTDEPLPEIPVGVNLGLSKSTDLTDAPADYRYTYDRLGESVDYAVVNVSSPNTPGLRSLQDRESLAAILGGLRDAGADPLLVKLSPDLPDPAVEEAIAVAEEHDLAGIVATNTTTDRPEGLSNPNHVESGGLSGAPVEERATRAVRFVAARTDLPVVGVGGVATAADAYRKIRAGASVVQLYTALVYEGPGVARAINEGLLELLERDGFDSVTEAVGVDC